MNIRKNMFLQQKDRDLTVSKFPVAFNCMAGLKPKPQGVLGPEADGGSCVSVGSGGPGVGAKLFSSFLSPERKSWMAVSI